MDESSPLCPPLPYTVIPDDISPSRNRMDYINPLPLAPLSPSLATVQNTVTVGDKPTLLCSRSRHDLVNEAPLLFP